MTPLRDVLRGLRELGLQCDPGTVREIYGKEYEREQDA